MDAFFARNRLSAYLDGELTAGEAREVEAALAADPALRAELDELRAAVDALRDGGIVEPPPGFADRLAARLEREPMPVGWRRWIRQIRPEGAMLAAAALLVVLYVGNHDSLPDLALPDDGVVAARAFDKGEEQAAQAKDEQVAGAEAAQSDVAAAPAQGLEEPPETLSKALSTAGGTSADGVLGNEAARPVAPAGKTQAMAEKPAYPSKTRGKKEALEVEPWKASWEQGEEIENTAAPGNTSQSTTVQWTSPPPFRYRVTASSDMAMKQLAAIANELGGSLQDSRGRPLAAYQLDEGESRSIRVSVPAHNASRLAERLREIGSVQTVKEPGNLLADPNADVGVQIELAL
jgi:negative regulator of sigma E activity